MFFIRSASFIIPPAAPNCPGAPEAEGMLARTVSCLMPAVVSTVTPLAIRPLLPARLRVTSMGPLEPGGMRQGWAGNLATVQPQEVRTLFTNTSEEETLVSQNVNGAFASPALGVYSFVSASHLIALGSICVTAGVGVDCGKT